MNTIEAVRFNIFEGLKKTTEKSCQFESRKPGHHQMSHDVCYVEGQRLLRACSNKVTGSAGTISGFGQRKCGILKRFRAGQFTDVVQTVALRGGSYLMGFFSNEFCGFNKQ
jgi:hypothetical protein